MPHFRITSGAGGGAEPVLQAVAGSPGTPHRLGKQVCRLGALRHAFQGWWLQADGIQYRTALLQYLGSLGQAVKAVHQTGLTGLHPSLAELPDAPWAMQQLCHEDRTWPVRAALGVQISSGVGKK